MGLKRLGQFRVPNAQSELGYEHEQPAFPAVAGEWNLSLTIAVFFQDHGPRLSNPSTPWLGRTIN